MKLRWLIILLFNYFYRPRSEIVEGEVLKVNNKNAKINSNNNKLNIQAT